MKIRLLFLSVFYVLNCNAQQWVRMMQDPNANFYDTQKEFYRHWEKKEEEERHIGGFFKKLFSRKEEEEEKPGYEIFKRWEWFNAPRVYPSGKRPGNSYLWKEFNDYTSRLNNNQTLNQGNWTPLGPNLLSTVSYSPGIGRVNVVAVDPINPNNVYLGAPAGGFWKSNDGGLTWSTTTDFLPSIGVSAIAIDPANSNTIYIGTGDRDAGDSYSIGILKSTDGGQTWNTTGLTWLDKHNRTMSKLLIDPGNNQIMLAASSVGIFKSTDAGVTWTFVLGDDIKDMEFKPGDPSIVYACGTKFYRSTNGGSNFTQISTGLPPSVNVNRLSIAVTPSSPGNVYVLGGNASNSGFNGFYFSNDDGLTFTQRANSPNLLGWATDGSDTDGQSWYDLTIAVDPNNPDNLLAGGVNIWMSLDGGFNWFMTAYWVYNNPNYSYVHADQHHMDVAGNDLWVGCDGGVFKSNDFGATFFDMTPGVAISQFYRLACSAQNSGIVMGGAQDNGCMQLKNGLWGQVYGADGMEVAVNPSNSQTLYVCSQNGGLRRSTNGGTSTTDIKNNINEDGDWVTPYVIDQSNPTNLYAGYANVWKTTNQGNSWTKISNFNGSTTITVLHLAPNNSNYIYIVRGGAFYRTTDGGANWSTINTNFPGAITYVAIDPVNADRIWVSTSGYSRGKRVYSSNDGGTTWTNYSGSLPAVPVNTIVYKNGSSDGLYVGTDLGVFYRDNNLSDWIPFWNGLPNVPVDELEIHYGSDKVRAATYGRGIWESNCYTVPTTPPLADFIADKINICPGETVNFTDRSLDAAPGWNWVFNGGNPSSSSVAVPAVVYSNPGVYDVQLTVSNAIGNNTATKTAYIVVSNPVQFSGSFTEDFQSGTFPLNGWRLDNLSNDNTWHLDNAAGGYGLSSTSLSLDNFFNNNPSSRDILLTAAYDLTSITNPVLKFDYAYSPWGGHPDTLRVFYTYDCGITRTTIFSKGGPLLNTAPGSTTYFIPQSTQWKTAVLNLSTVPNLTNIQFGFEGVNGYGNVIYLDNINVSQAVGIEQAENGLQVNVYPNPAEEELHVVLDQPGNYEIEISDLLGRKILKQSLTTKMSAVFIGSLNNGVYSFSIFSKESGLSVFRKKIIKEEK